MAKKNSPTTLPNDPGPEFRPRPDEHLGAYLRRLRLLRGLDQVAVCDRTPKSPESQHLSPPYLSQLEHGRALHPSREKLESLAHVLDVPEAWVLEKAGFSANTLEGSAALPSPVASQIARRATKLDARDQEIVLSMIESILRHRSGSS